MLRIFMDFFVCFPHSTQTHHAIDVTNLIIFFKKEQQKKKKEKFETI